MITRWDPYRELLGMRRAMDRLMESSLGDGETDTTSQWGVALDVVEDDDSYKVKASLPGISPDDLEITFNKGMLTIRGEVKDEAETVNGQYHLRERRYGTFARTISLPSTIKAEDIHADYQDGILTLTLPKAEEIKPKRIQVQTRKAIEPEVK